MCPHCQNSDSIIKRGKFTRDSDGKKIQRYQCKKCLKSFSDQTLRFDYRQKKRRINQSVFRLLCKGMSQRGVAQVLGINKKSVASRVIRFGKESRKHLLAQRCKIQDLEEVMFDEMESFEHTKLKPLTIPLMVDPQTRRILGVSVGKIAAKGLLAKISVKKYGKRKCERAKVLDELFSFSKCMMKPECVLKSDESQHYPRVVRNYFPSGIHERFKGRKPAVVGQGEMKKGGFDPLFALNQTAAMIRDNIKRLARRTWCTTKKVERLLDLLMMYAHYHNQKIVGVRMPRIWNCGISN